MAGEMHSERYRALMRVLVAARRDAGLTQTALATKLGKPQPYVSKVERGERRLDLVEFCDWAAATDLSPEILLRAFVEAAT